MGMFDSIIVKYKLPEIDLNGTSLTMEDIQNGSYQTKDLDCSLTTYTLEKSGRVSYKIHKIHEWVECPDSPLKGYIDRKDERRKYLSGNHVIEFYDFVYGTDKHDYDITWEALVVGGKATSVKLKSFKKICNKQRKQNSLELEESLKQFEIYKNTFRYKYFMKHFLKCKRTFVFSIIGFLNKVISFLYKI